MLNAKETASKLGVSVKTLYRWIKKGIVPHTKRVGRYYFDLREVLSKIDKKRDV